MSGIPTVHHSLCHVDPGPGDIGALIDIDHTTHWSAMNTHPQPNLRVLFHCATDLHRAFHRLFRALVKNQRHPIPARDLCQSTISFGVLKPLGPPDSASQFINCPMLIVNRKLRVTNDIDEQNMRDLELNLLLNLRHRPTCGSKETSLPFCAKTQRPSDCSQAYRLPRSAQKAIISAS